MAMWRRRQSMCGLAAVLDAVAAAATTESWRRSARRLLMRRLPGITSVMERVKG
jgi:hypothetical protein